MVLVRKRARSKALRKKISDMRASHLHLTENHTIAESAGFNLPITSANNSETASRLSPTLGAADANNPTSSTQVERLASTTSTSNRNPDDTRHGDDGSRHDSSSGKASTDALHLISGNVKPSTTSDGSTHRDGDKLARTEVMGTGAGREQREESGGELEAQRNGKEGNKSTRVTSVVDDSGVLL